MDDYELAAHVEAVKLKEARWMDRLMWLVSMSLDPKTAAKNLDKIHPRYIKEESENIEEQKKKMKKSFRKRDLIRQRNKLNSLLDVIDK